MCQTMCPDSTNQLQHHSTKGHHDILYGSTTLLFKQPSSRSILPFCNYTSNAKLSRIQGQIFSTVCQVIIFIACISLLTIFFDFPAPIYPHLQHTKTYTHTYTHTRHHKHTSASFLNHTAGTIPCPSPSLTPLTKFQCPTLTFPKSFT